MNSHYSVLKKFFTFNWVQKYETPQFGIVSLWILLILALHSSLDFKWIHPGHPDGSIVSLIGVFPQHIIQNILFMKISLYLFWMFSLLWAAQIWIRYTSLLSVIFYFLAGAFYLENRIEQDHTFILLTQVLILYCFWYQFDSKSIKESQKQKTFWQTKLFPQWMYPAVLILVGYQYFTSAILRFFTSGLSWADGASLQIWAFLWGDPLSPLTQAIINDQFLASILQQITLWLELLCPVLVVFRLTRWVAGLFLIGFHLSGQLIFEFDFFYHFVIIILYFYPWQKLVK